MHSLKNGNWKELKYDMILGGIFNIWRYLTYSPPLRPCTAGLDVAKTRRLGVTCSRINSSSGNYGITPSTPQPKTLISTQRLPKSVNTSKMWISTSVLPNFKVYFLFFPVVLCCLHIYCLPLFLKYYASSFTYFCDFSALWDDFHIIENTFFFKETSPGKCSPIKPYYSQICLKSVIQNIIKCIKHASCNSPLKAIYI